MTIKYVPAKNYQKANRAPKDITLLVIHTAECGEVSTAAENLQSWTAGPNASVASWHYAVDNDSVTQSCLEKDIAWHAGPVNGYSIGIEHAGYASQGKKGWEDDYSKAVLENSARLAADICHRNGIPIERLSAADLKAGRLSGICGHVDVTNGLSNGKGHTDPGPHFPWDSWLARVRELSGIVPLAKPETIVAPAAVTTELRGFVEVECDGVKWEVCPVYVGPIGIGQARDVAASLGCELPTPALVDAIWKAADLKIDANVMVNGTHDGTPKTMDSPEIHAAQAAKIARAVGEKSLGIDFFLLAGAFKDIVQRKNPSNGKIEIGLYGWHRANGQVIQPFFGGHALAWRDYSQGLRLVRRKA